MNLRTSPWKVRLSTSNLAHGVRDALTPVRAADWPQEEAEQSANGGNEHLWEESWDDDDAAEDFSKQLKYVSPTPDSDRLISTPLPCSRTRYSLAPAGHKLTYA